MADVLLVEGPDDMHVFKHLCEFHNISSKIAKMDDLSADAINIINAEGFPNVRKRLKLYPKLSGVTRLGVVVDADTNALARWISLRDALADAGYDRASMPAAPIPQGTLIQQPGKIGVGLWIMPDNTAPGMLEHFVRALVPAGDLLWSLAESCVDHIPPEHRRFTQPIKAHVHTWLAWQAEPGKPMSTAITINYLDGNAPTAQPFVAWLRRLFALN